MTMVSNESAKALSPEVLFLVDTNLIIRACEGDMPDLWGYEPEEAVSRSFLSLFDPADRPLLQSHFTQRSPGKFERTLTGLNHKDERILVETAVFSIGGQRIALVKKPGLNLPFDFASLSHELKNPLNSVIGISRILLKKNPRKDQLELMQALNFSAENLMTLANDILDYSRIEAGKAFFDKVNFDLGSLLKNLEISFKQAAEAKKLDFQMRISSGTPQFLNGDPARLSQILYNLVGNAVKFTHSGTVSVEVSHFEQDQILFRISDTGIGIPENKIATIFHPFEQAYQRQSAIYGGSGLGLTIASRIIRLLGGTIAVKSKEGKGSEFTVTLPLEPAHKSGPDEREEQVVPPGSKGFKILYIEDQFSNQLLIGEYCLHAGGSAEFASTGDEAVNKVRSKTYDLILVDLRLGDEDGREVARRIRELPDPYFKNVPIIALTASAAAANIKSYGINDIIRKPVTPGELNRKIIDYTGINAGMPQDFNTSKGGNASFEWLDALYSEKSREYISLLELMLQEYERYQESLLLSLKSRNMKKYRSVVHNMKSNLAAMGMNDFIRYLNEIREARERREKIELGQVASELSGYFDQVKNLLNEKIRELTQD